MNLRFCERQRRYRIAMIRHLAARLGDAFNGLPPTMRKSAFRIVNTTMMQAVSEVIDMRPARAMGLIDESDVLKPRTRRRLYIYFVQQRLSTNDGPIKIGVSGNVAARVSALQSASTCPLVVLGTTEAKTASSESEMHMRFRDDRLSGEWFRPSVALLSFIAALGAK